MEKETKRKQTKSKYKDTLFDGRWKVVGTDNHKYQLENIYNHRIIEIANDTMSNLAKGKTTISNIISYRAAQNPLKPNRPYFNAPKCQIRRQFAVYNNIKRKENE